jgi:predicted RNase H-like HicB family nuclease
VWRKALKLEYTYWNTDDGWLVGFLDDFPGWWTQGKDIQELEIMLLDLYDLCDDEESFKSARETGKIEDREFFDPDNVSHGSLKIPVAVPV